MNSATRDFEFGSFMAQQDSSLLKLNSFSTTKKAVDQTF